MGAFLLMIGVAAVAAGTFIGFAGMMSDAPDVGDRYGRTGCGVALVGALSLIVGAATLIRGLL